MDWLFMTALWAATLPVYDGDFACIGAEKAQSYVREFNINVQSFGGLELCNHEADTKKLFNDLMLVEQGQISAPAQNVFIKNFVPQDQYFDWLKRQTYGIDRGNDMPYATAYNSGGYFTMQDGWAKLSTLGRVGTVIHEARHTEGYSHRQCHHGPYQGSRVSGCDHSVSQGGSHGIEMEYYARVYLAGVNFHPAYQAMARLMLLGRANFVFNEHAMSQADELIIRTNEGLIQLQENQRHDHTWASPLAPSLAMKRTSFGATLLDSNAKSAWAIDLANNSSAQILEDEYSYYKLLQLNPPSQLVDMEEVDQGIRRYMLALSKDGSLYSYVFAEGQWSAPKRHPGATRLATLSPDGDSGIFLIYGNNRYCRLDPWSLECAESPQPWPETAKAFLKYRNSTLRLDHSGRIEQLDGQPLPEVGSKPVIDAVQIPRYDAFGAI